MGLGLSIAKGFIEAHGGKITAVNRDSGGLEFLIYLP
jgi:two-component system sensor histidine kinase KdpD